MQRSANIDIAPSYQMPLPAMLGRQGRNPTRAANISPRPNSFQLKKLAKQECAIQTDAKTRSFVSAEVQFLDRTGDEIEPCRTRATTKPLPDKHNDHLLALISTLWGPGH